MNERNLRSSFPSSQNRMKKRHLAVETLEPRSMLSIAPLGWSEVTPIMAALNQFAEDRPADELTESPSLLAESGHFAGQQNHGRVERLRALSDDTLPPVRQTELRRRQSLGFGGPTLRNTSIRHPINPVPAPSILHVGAEHAQPSVSPVIRTARGRMIRSFFSEEGGFVDIRPIAYQQSSFEVRTPLVSFGDGIDQRTRSKFLPSTTSASVGPRSIAVTVDTLTSSTDTLTSSRNTLTSSTDRLTSSTDTLANIHGGFVEIMSLETARRHLEPEISDGFLAGTSDTIIEFYTDDRRFVRQGAYTQNSILSDPKGLSDLGLAGETNAGLSRLRSLREFGTDEGGFVHLDSASRQIQLDPIGATTHASTEREPNSPWRNAVNPALFWLVDLLSAESTTEEATRKETTNSATDLAWRETQDGPSSEGGIVELPTSSQQAQRAVLQDSDVPESALVASSGHDQPIYFASVHPVLMDAGLGFFRAFELAGGSDGAGQAAQTMPADSDQALPPDALPVAGDDATAKHKPSEPTLTALSIHQVGRGAVHGIAAAIPSVVIVGALIARNRREKDRPTNES